MGPARRYSSSIDGERAVSSFIRSFIHRGPALGPRRSWNVRAADVRPEGRCGVGSRLRRPPRPSAKAAVPGGRRVVRL